MHQSLNRGLWRSLENYEREISKKSILKVKIIISFNDPLKQTSGGAVIPDSFMKILEYKIVEDNQIKNIKEIYKFKNDSSMKGKPLKNYLIKL